MQFVLECLNGSINGSIIKTEKSYGKKEKKQPTDRPKLKKETKQNQLHFQAEMLKMKESNWRG